MNKGIVTRQYKELRDSGFEPKVAGALAVGILLADKFDNLSQHLLSIDDTLDLSAGLVKRDEACK